MTLSDLQGHSFIVSHFKCNFTCSYTAVDKVPTNRASRGPSEIAELNRLTISRYISEKVQNMNIIFGMLT